MRPKTKDLFQQLDSITFDDIGFDEEISHNDQDRQNRLNLDQRDYDLEDDYFDYYSDHNSSSHSSSTSFSDSYTRSSETSMSDLSSQFESFKRDAIQEKQIHVSDPHSFQQGTQDRSQQVTQVTRGTHTQPSSPQVPPRDSLKNFNHTLFQQDLSAMNSGVVNNKSMLDCINDMLTQENEFIINEMNRFVNEINDSVANNTFIVKLNR